MNNMSLNLARKWRSKNFDQIVGQELSVSMLKNSLYAGQYFPVYLFSGQRGCGKTTTARVFASAVNCDQLDSFKKDPNIHSIPCLQCLSCKAMLAGKHPDFIEIDAASHTGVDNVRQIVSASQLLPLMGKKKIYLIDEAHMLSKAAFNAFLKILEEPPSSVIFILATTDVKKIIDTVKSRCFQLFFNPVSNEPLLDYLKNVCVTENISHEDSALCLIIKETQGSVRDALNVLEQVRFACETVSKNAVLNVLGHVDDERILEMVNILLQKSQQDLIVFLKELKFNFFSPDFFWNKLVEIFRASVWIKYGVVPDWYTQYSKHLEKIIANCSVERLNKILRFVHENEQFFLKTTSKHSLLEMILLQICQKNTCDFGDTGSSPVSQSTISLTSIEDCCSEDLNEDFQDDDNQGKDKDFYDDIDVHPVEWNQFLVSLDTLNDPLLSSIFKHAEFIKYDAKNGNLDVRFSKQFSFFKETIDETVSMWLPLLNNSYCKNVVFIPHFTGDQKEKVITSNSNLSDEKGVCESSSNISDDVRATDFSEYEIKKNISKKKGCQVLKSIDVSDDSIWKKASIISKYFPGTFTELDEV